MQVYHSVFFFSVCFSLFLCFYHTNHVCNKTLYLFTLFLNIEDIFLFINHDHWSFTEEKELSAFLTSRLRSEASWSTAWWGWRRGPTQSRWWLCSQNICHIHYGSEGFNKNLDPQPGFRYLSSLCLWPVHWFPADAILYSV